MVMFSGFRNLLARWFGYLGAKVTSKQVTNGHPLKLSLNTKEKAGDFELAFQLVPYDDNLLERARTQWQFGDWQSLTRLDKNILQHHPDRAKLALLVAAGHLQIGDTETGREFIRFAQTWGISKNHLTRILIATAQNSLGRAAAMSNNQPRALRHFESAISVGTPGTDTRLLAQARYGEQLNQLGLVNNSMFLRVGAGRTADVFDSQLATSKVSPDSVDDKYSNFSSGQYWEERYQKGGTSGYGSSGKLAEFKAHVVNKFITEKTIKSVIEFGCGDGIQLSLIRIASYVGIDVSDTAIQECRKKFDKDHSKTFYTYNEFSISPKQSELTLSMDVIFHLVEDKIYNNYMSKLFSTSTLYCIIYSCDEEQQRTDAEHVRRRKFTKWISRNLKNWRLTQIIYNKYPHDGSQNPKETSFSNFYFYEKVNQHDSVTQP